MSESSSASDVVELLEDCIFHLFGYPRKIVTDSDPRFTSKFWANSLDLNTMIHYRIIINLMVLLKPRPSEKFTTQFVKDNWPNFGKFALDPKYFGPVTVIAVDGNNITYQGVDVNDIPYNFRIYEKIKLLLVNRIKL
eukprot:gene6708-8308_t